MVDEEKIATRNIFEDSDAPERGERLEALLERGRVEIERIISAQGSHSKVYCQTQDEWVMVMRGAATLEVAGVTHELAPGDHLFIPAQTTHRVLQTSEGTLWLAVHIHPEGGGGEAA